MAATSSEEEKKMLLPCVVGGKEGSKQVMCFMAGFPDDERS